MNMITPLFAMLIITLLAGCQGAPELVPCAFSEDLLKIGVFALIYLALVLVVVSPIFIKGGK